MISFLSSNLRCKTNRLPGCCVRGADFWFLIGVCAVATFARSPFGTGLSASPDAFRVSGFSGCFAAIRADMSYDDCRRVGINPPRAAAQKDRWFPDSHEAQSEQPRSFHRLRNGWFALCGCFAWQSSNGLSFQLRRFSPRQSCIARLLAVDKQQPKILLQKFPAIPCGLLFVQTQETRREQADAVQNNQ